MHLWLCFAPRAITTPLVVQVYICFFPSFLHSRTSRFVDKTKVVSLSIPHQAIFFNENGYDTIYNLMTHNRINM